MSGWDTSSTHTWGQQDGPDETQAFAAPGGGSRDFGEDFGSQEFGRMAPGSPPSGFPAQGGGFPGERSGANPPPEFFGQGYGQDPQGSGAYPQRTPGRSLHDMPQRDMRPAAHDGGYGQDGGYGDNGYGQDGGYGQEAQYGQDPGYGQDGAFGQDWGAADQGDGWGGGRTVGRPGVPWDDRGQRDGGYQDLDGGFGRQDPGRLGYGGQDYTSQDYPAQDYAGQDFPGQQGRGMQAPSSYGRREQDSAARMDPALQDFFAPQSDFAPQPGGGPGFPREPQYRPDDDGWGGWDGSASPQPPRTGTGPRPLPRPAPRGGGGGDDRRGLGLPAIIGIGVVVAVIIVVAYVVLSKGSGKTPTASNSPSGAASTSASKPSASKSAAAAATTYKLSTPTTAGGYAQGQDPHFLATATTTAGQIVTAVKSGGGGTVKGDPVSAAYTLPASQVITFVGYQGTFTPAKVATILATLGSDPHTYPAGTNGGMLGCANTPPSATATSGAVCVWATTSTLGITEFFDSTGPEALTTSQSKGAADTVKLRADVEAKA